MRCLEALLVLLFDYRTLSKTTTVSAKEITSENKIVRGFSAQLAQYPFAGFLASYDPTRGNYHECGSSIVSSVAIVTACHCVATIRTNATPRLYQPSFSHVIVGSTSRIDSTDGTQSTVPGPRTTQVRSGKQIVVHPSCARLGIGEVVNFDFGIMIVNRPFDLNDFVRPMNFPSRDKYDAYIYYRKFDKETKICQAIGWGLTKMGQSTKDEASHLLQIARVVIQDRYTCENKIRKSSRKFPEWNSFSRYNLERAGHICAYPLGNATVNYKDMGGPLVCEQFVVGLIASQLEISDRFREQVNLILFTSLFAVFDELRKYFPTHGNASGERRKEVSSTGNSGCSNLSRLVTVLIINVYGTKGVFF